MQLLNHFPLKYLKSQDPTSKKLLLWKQVHSKQILLY